MNGANESGNISSPAQAQSWTFDANAGDAVLIGMSKVGSAMASLEPYLQLYDPNGDRVTGNYDLLGVKISVTAALTGTYTVAAASWNGYGTGSYSITLVKIPGAFTVSDGDEGGTIFNGVAVSGVAQRADLDPWTFLANQGDVISISMTNASGDPNFTPVFDLYDPDGVRVTGDFGGSGAYASATALISGAYTVVAGNANPRVDSSGSYTLVVSGSTATSMCPVIVSPAPASYGISPAPFMQATFVAPTGAMLTNYAKTCGFDNFNWQQQITVDPGEKAVWPQNPSNVPNNVFPAPSCSMLTSAMFPLNNCLLVAGPASLTNIYGNYPPYYDPPKGGYAGGEYASLVVPFDPYPFVYYTAAVTSLGSCTLPGFCPPKGNFPFILSSDKTTLTFLDAPAHPSLPGDPPSTTPMAGHFIAFSTALVGVDGTGSAHTLFSWTWNSTFNGTAGAGGVTCLSGCAQTVAVAPIIPGSGTGGVTITSINGVQLPSVLSSSRVATTASGLAYSRVNQTFNGTVTITNISNSAISGPLQIVFFGMPSGITLVNATRNLSGTPYITVPAVASLAPGQSASVSVQFRNPSNATINLAPVIYSGSIN